MIFQTTTGKKVNPITHTSNIVKKDPFVEIHIGTDSQRHHGADVVYVTAIAYRYIGKGVHYIYNKTVHPPIKDDWTKLWKETEYSLDVAEYLAPHLPGIRFEIDMDYNSDENALSNKLVAAATGWGTSLGYKCNIKPVKQIATRAADHHCR